jgi:murein DD-endopeptidase MepM/ murein hydrolase activator NlpD
MEDGKVFAADWTEGPSSTPYPGCAGLGVQGNYLQVQSDPDDGYTTIYFHIVPLPQYRSKGAQVHAGDLLGNLDNSGCQSGAHLHVGRKDRNRNPVNFTILCVNSIPTSRYDDGAVGDDVPDVLSDDTP